MSAQSQRNMPGGHKATLAARLGSSPLPLSMQQYATSADTQPVTIRSTTKQAIRDQRQPYPHTYAKEELQ